jgi:hypothetical protein
MCLLVIVVVGCLASDAFAQPGRRAGGRRIVDGLRGATPAAGAAQPDAPARQPGPLREGLRNLGGTMQGALKDGTLDPLLSKAIAPDMQPGVPVASPLGATSNLKASLSTRNQPFTPAWYAEHPQAWQYTHPHADAWAVATFAGAAAWLSVTAAAPANSASGENVFTDASVAPEPDSEVAGDFLPLGVFALAPAGAQDPSALIQLALNKAGEVQGNYYDVITGQDLVLSGAFDKQTQLATFKLATPGSAEFEVSLVSLTRTSGSARVRFESGESRDWSLVRFEPPAADAK